MKVKEDWAGLDRALCKRIRAPVVIFDNRGIGESDVPDTPYTIPLFVSDLKTVVEHALGKVPIDLLGISMGGCIVQMAALSGLLPVRRIVLGCTTPGGPETKPGPGLVACMQLVEEACRAKSEKHDPRALVTDLEYHNLPSAWIEDHPDIFEQYIVDQLRYRRPLPGLLGQMRALSKFNVSRSIHSLQTPSLILHGDADNVIPLESAQLLAQKLPNSELYVLEGAAHLFWITHLHDATRSIASFLNKPPSYESKHQQSITLRSVQPSVQSIRVSPTASSSQTPRAKL
jgi:pimeloyl-ACP methyl ester carboxylesterase